MQRINRRHLIFLCLTIVGSGLALAGDLLIGCVEPGALGKYGMIQASWAKAALWRPALSLVLASIAFPLYLPGLYVVSRKMEASSPRAGRAFLITTCISATGWLLLHALYCIPQFVYKYVFDAGYPALALELSDKIIGMGIPSLIAAGLPTLAAYVILFIEVIRKKTPYSRWCVLMNPLVTALATVILAAIFPASIFFAGLSMCKLNLGMFLFFIAAAVYEYRGAGYGGQDESRISGL